MFPHFYIYYIPRCGLGIYWLWPCCKSSNRDYSKTETQNSLETLQVFRYQYVMIFIWWPCVTTQFWLKVEERSNLNTRSRNFSFHKNNLLKYFADTLLVCLLFLTHEWEDITLLHCFHMFVSMSDTVISIILDK